MTTAETGKLYANVQNNNIVWKNMTIVGDGGGRTSAAVVANYGEEPQEARLVFSVPREEPVTMYDWGQACATGARTFTRREESGRSGASWRPRG